jgi:hypothetical protein
VCLFIRLSAQELLECSFLAVEPDVVILENDPSHTIVTLQVVFKGSDKLSVKFEFNTVSSCDLVWLCFLFTCFF